VSSGQNTLNLWESCGKLHSEDGLGTRLRHLSHSVQFSKQLPDALTSFLILAVFDGSKLPKAALFEKLDLLLKPQTVESARFSSERFCRAPSEAGLRAAHLSLEAEREPGNPKEQKRPTTEWGEG
jgi:hypothetical protein